MSQLIACYLQFDKYSNTSKLYDYILCLLFCRVHLSWSTNNRGKTSRLYCHRYQVERKCKLAQIGGLLDNKGYGIVMKKSEYIIFIITLCVRCCNSKLLDYFQKSQYRNRLLVFCLL